MGECRIELEYSSCEGRLTTSLIHSIALSFPKSCWTKRKISTNKKMGNNQSGGGIRIDDSTVTLEMVVLENNQAYEVSAYVLHLKMHHDY